MNIDEEISKTFVYPNGDVLDVVKVREALIYYWKMTVAEKRAFTRMIEKYKDVPDQYKQTLDGKV